MVLKSLKPVLFGLLVGVAGQSMAKINLNVDATMGRRWIEFKQKDTAGKSTAYANEYALGAQYQIIDLPISVGGNFSLVDFNNKDLERGGQTVDTAYGLEVGFGGKVWIPDTITQTSMVVPFVKVGFIAY